MRIQDGVIADQAATWEITAEAGALRLLLPAPLAPGASTDITLVYEATVPVIPPQGYKIFSFTGGTAALAGFYPAVAVYDEEGWNIEAPPIYGDATYLDISLYQVKLTVPAQMVVAASGSLLDETTNSDGTKTLNFASGPIREFYLVLRPDFQVASQTLEGITVNSYYPPALEADGKLALQYAVDALRVFNQSFGPYPYKEFDVVATPTQAGGVEYPGIVVIAENVYSQHGIFFPYVVVHEVAHQWWYGLVGNDQVDEPWLDESLTNYSTILYWEEIAGRDTAANVIETFFQGPYRRAQSENIDQSVLGAVSDYDQTDYGIFIYGKGPLFFDALRREVGEETYLKIMQSYFNEYKYGIAHTEDLFETIKTISGKDITPLVETWLEVK
jgi:aminopeptidase N